MAIPGEIEIEKCVEEFIADLMSDSGIPRSMSGQVRLALIADIDRNGRLPDEYERECLVYGGPVDPDRFPDRAESDDDGDRDVDALWPATSAAIAELF